MIKEQLENIKMVGIFAVVMIVWGYFIFPVWSIMLLAWFSAAIWILIKKYHLRLHARELMIFLSTIYLYPLLETFIKLFIDSNVIPYSWIWLNRIEHASFNIALCILLYPFFIKELNKVSVWALILLYPALIITIGNLNEIWEYLLRLFIVNSDMMRIYYEDTIIDMTVNLVASYLGVIILRLGNLYYRPQK